MQTDFDIFFRDYADAFNRALSGQLVLDEVRAAFADSFVAANPNGVTCGRNDDQFAAVLEQAYDFYRRIGTRRMTVTKVEPTQIDGLHTLARVSWRADYEKPNGEAVQIDFEVAYLLRDAEPRPQIFAFVGGDETAAYEKHGLLPDVDDIRLEFVEAI
jgi:hypothetical protein